MIGAPPLTARQELRSSPVAFVSATVTNRSALLYNRRSRVPVGFSTNGIVKPFLHKQHLYCILSLSPVLVPPLCDLRHDLYSNSEPDSQPTNYKCGILPGRTDPFPSCCPLTSTTFPPPLHATVAPKFACPKPTNPILPQSHPISSPLQVCYKIAYRPHSHF